MSLEIFLQLFDYLGLTIENQENKFSDLTEVVEHLVYANNQRSQV